MEVGIGRFKSLVGIFGGILETYLETYLTEHPNATMIQISADDKFLTKLVNCLLDKKCIADMEVIMRYSSSVVLYPDTKFDINDLERACQLGHLKYAKWLELKPTQRAVDLAVQGDHTDVVEWCLTIVPDLKINIDLLYKYDAIAVATQFGQISDMNFIESCRQGALRIIQHLLIEKPNIKVYYNNNCGFRLACQHGHLKLAKWLVANYNISEVDYDRYSVFRCTCRNGHLDVAQWLLMEYPEIDVHIDDENAFRWACDQGHLNVVQWFMIEYPETNVHTRDEEAFRWACQSGRSKVVQWLLTQYPKINVHAKSDYAFRWACKNKHLSVIQLLVGKYEFPEYMINLGLHTFGVEIFGMISV